MKNLSVMQQKVVVGAIVGVVSFVAVSMYVSYTRAAVEAELMLRVAAQAARVNELGELIAQDRANETVAAAIADCSPEERQRFDTQLGVLNTLRGAELTEIDRLFAACGDFFALQRSVMVGHLAREVTVYAEYSELLALQRGQAEPDVLRASAWQNIVTEEQRRSELGARLVAIQGEIIDLLVAGARSSDDAVAILLAEAQEVRENLSFVGMQIERMRSDVAAL